MKYVLCAEHYELHELSHRALIIHEIINIISQMRKLNLKRITSHCPTKVTLCSVSLTLSSKPQCNMSP